ncbi:MAG: OmpH family outer membrane protein [Saprospiraceae bacterium]|nr:OmpH family outer membrane protein [Saprospiraceae bacterium]
MFFFLALLLGAFSAQGQKFGYINSGEILAALPEVKQAEANIEALRKQLEKNSNKTFNYCKRLIKKHSKSS